MVLGITGGVGAGKSTILDFLREKYNAYVIIADDVAKELMEPGKVCCIKAAEHFGKEILSEDGSIDRKKMAQLIFCSEEMTREINAIVHPAVKTEIERQIENVRIDEPGRLIVIEAALLEEGGEVPLCDEIWFIYTEKEIRIRRIMESRGYDRTRCLNVIARQKSDDQFRAYSTEEIDNSGSIDNTRRQVYKLMEKCFGIREA